MQSAASQTISLVESGALCGIADPDLAASIRCEIEERPSAGAISVANSLSHLIERLTECHPKVILLDDELVSGAPLGEFLRQLNEIAPVVLIASIDRQKEIAGFVIEGKVEFVSRNGDFASLAASLVSRHLRPARPFASGAVPWSGMADDIAEIFRHDINNPLTGILGNAELVLSHSSRLPPADIQRLQTVVELAVRLRETIRQLSDAWEAQSRKSA